MKHTNPILIKNLNFDDETINEYLNWRFRKRYELNDYVRIVYVTYNNSLDERIDLLGVTIEEYCCYIHLGNDFKDWTIEWEEFPNFETHKTSFHETVKYLREFKKITERIEQIVSDFVELFCNYDLTNDLNVYKEP